MPISFLEEQPQVEERLRARQFVREFASHRWGVFKESGFRSDPMYPAFSGLAGLSLDGGAASLALLQARSASLQRRNASVPAADYLLWALSNNLNQSASEQLVLDEQRQQELGGANSGPTTASFKGFDDQWNECRFETAPSSGSPAANAQKCLPFLVSNSNEAQAASEQQQQQQHSFNLMSADPFSYASQSMATQNSNSDGLTPSLEPNLQLAAKLPASLTNWRQLASSARFYFCGENFPAPAANQLPASGVGASGSNVNQLQHQQQNQIQPQLQAGKQMEQQHKQSTVNKQNKLCHERSALEVIKSSNDFRKLPFR